jgi:Flp pilus assembly protein TadG
MLGAAMTRSIRRITSRVLPTFRGQVRLFRLARQGASALEFAFVSIPLVMLLIGTMSFAYAYYLQFVLDYSLQQAVRQVQIGNVSGSTTVAAFTSSVMCPIFVQFASCTGLNVSVQVVQDYWNSYSTVTGTTQPTAFCIGQPGALMFARATYQAPVWAKFMVSVISPSPSSTGQNIVSTAAFANENPAGTRSTAAAGC